LVYEVSICFTFGSYRNIAYVDCHASVDTVGQGGILHDGYALVGAVRMLKKHACCPVVAIVVSFKTHKEYNLTNLKSSEKVQVVQLANSPGSLSIVALKALPPTI
jgi:prepilin-type processing-associated H-X9-DG protein